MHPMSIHSYMHDSAGFLKKAYNIGPGYSYLDGKEAKSFDILVQWNGIRYWFEKCYQYNYIKNKLENDDEWKDKRYLAKQMFELNYNQVYIPKLFSKSKYLPAFLQFIPEDAIKLTYYKDIRNENGQLIGVDKYGYWSEVIPKYVAFTGGSKRS